MRVRFLIVGAGMHGLSTAWHLAKARGSGDGIVVLDKTGPGAGATGIACGVVRNNYAQPAMRRLMAHSVAIWEANATALAYHPVGYLQISPEAMHSDVARIYEEQRAIGYDSSFIEGAAASRDYLRDLFPDWRAQGITSVLHEHQGGYANNKASVAGLRALAEEAGVRILSGVEVTGVGQGGGAVSGIETTQGPIECEQLIIAAGPWVRELWTMLDLPETIADGRPMWTYWMLQEGTVEVDPASFTDRRGNPPPVIHVDTDAPLHDDDGLVTDQLWGIYYKPDTGFGGVQGGCMPRRVSDERIAVDPYGPLSKEYQVDEQFIRMWTAGLAHCHERFAGVREKYRREPSGGIGCFTPDSFPVFDVFRQNAYVIADSNHGYKMIGVGALVAKEILGERQELLEPFRYSRYERGETHPASNSPFPWS